MTTGDGSLKEGIAADRRAEMQAILAEVKAMQAIVAELEAIRVLNEQLLEEVRRMAAGR